MITKVLSSVAIAFGAAVAVATPAGADPSAFGVLNCSCEQVIPDGMTAVPDQTDLGIQNGLAYFRHRPGLINS